MGKLILNNNKIMGSGNPIIIEKITQIKGNGVSPVLNNNLKENLMVGGAIVLNKPSHTYKKRPLKLNI